MIEKLKKQGRIRRCAENEKYWVTDDGRVFSEFSRRFLSAGRSSNGYYTVSIRSEGRRQSFLIQQLVMSAFVGPRPQGMLILHRNDIRDDNRFENLYYGTRSDNHHDVTRNGKRKFTATAIRQIRKLRDQGKKLKEIATAFDCHPNHVSYICTRKQYASVD